MTEIIHIEAVIERDGEVHLADLPVKRGQREVSPMLLLDTDVMIDVLRKHTQALDWLAAHDTEEVV